MAYKALMLGNQMAKCNMTKEEQAKLNKEMNAMLHPFRITKITKQQEIDSTWDLLRRRS